MDEVRLENGLVQTDVAGIMKISYRAYQDKISGKSRWKIEELVRFHEATGADFKVDVDGRSYAIIINRLQEAK